MKNQKIVVYTALFGNYSGLIEQPEIEGVDYICYTDQDFTSNSWEVKKVTPPVPGDDTRSSRYYKINPHKHLQDYEISVFIDANYLILKDFKEMVFEKLKHNLFVSFDHNVTFLDKRNCVYEECKELVRMANEENVVRDDKEVMQNQIDFFREEQYPKNNGLIFSAVLIRRHLNKEVIDLMELWWKFVSTGSKRDQLSFDYCAWKLNFNKFEYLNLDLRTGNPWFRWFLHNLNFENDLKALRKELFIKKYFPFIPNYLNSLFNRKLKFIINYPYLKLKFHTWCNRYSNGTITQEEQISLFKKTKRQYLNKTEIVSEIYKLTKSRIAKN